VLRGGVDAHSLNAGANNAKFGGQEDVGAAVWVQLEPLADEVFRVGVAVRCVPVGTANLPCPVQDL
jgi:hypothetical protein